MHIHILGICGTFMAGVARLAAAAGHKVTGSDANVYPPMSDQLKDAGIELTQGYNAEDISIKPDLWVIGNAIGRGNPLLEEILDRGEPYTSGPQWLSENVLRGRHVLAVAGTHGKTTTSTMAAHIIHQSHVGCNAFLGGISKNYGTNYLLNSSSPYVVIEADEYDRSFHWLTPYASVITAVDADHLDIYGTHEAYIESFEKYTSLIRKGGALVIHKNLNMTPQLKDGVRLFDYSIDEGNFHAENIRIGNGRIMFDFVSPFGNITNIDLGVPVYVNIENGIAAMALAQIAGVSAEDIREGVRTFSGVERRFDFKIKTDKIVLVSDYAHHPKEIDQCIKSVRKVFSGRKITAVFQPHLYSRTRDFYKEFAKSLSLLDEVILTEIYPARERLIPGVTSRLIYDELRPDMKRMLVRKDEVLDVIRSSDIDVLIILGAGDLDTLTPEIEKILLPRS